MKSSLKMQKKKKLQGSFAGISKMPKRLYSMVQNNITKALTMREW